MIQDLLRNQTKLP